MNAPKYPGMFAVGQPVVTTQDAGSEDWIWPARRDCRWGARGIVRESMTGHGWTYLVTHEDGTRAWYEHEELREPGSEPPGDDAREGVTTSVVPCVAAGGEAKAEEMKMQESST